MHTLLDSGQVENHVSSIGKSGPVPGEETGLHDTRPLVSLSDSDYLGCCDQRVKQSYQV